MSDSFCYSKTTSFALGRDITIKKLIDLEQEPLSEIERESEGRAILMFNDLVVKVNLLIKCENVSFQSLQNEYAILQKISELEIAPIPIKYYANDRAEFLVITRIPGQPLSHLQREHLKFLSALKEILILGGKLSLSGVKHGDWILDNLIVDGPGGLKIIDFGHAASTSKTKAFKYNFLLKDYDPKKFNRPVFVALVRVIEKKIPACYRHGFRRFLKIGKTRS